VKEAGYGFEAAEEIPLLLDRLVDEYEPRQSKIAIPSLSEVCAEYLKTLELA
jgi:hypothetical protein